MDEIKLPEPFGYVSDFKHAGIRIMSFQYAPYDQSHSLYHSTREVYTADQLRAAVEADRARRQTPAEAVCQEAAPAAPQPAHRDAWATLIRLADYLKIDIDKARHAPGLPSDVFIAAIAKLTQPAQQKGASNG